MKLKAVLFDNTPSALVAALEKIRPDVMGEVLVPHLKVPQDFGPAEFYVQRSDMVFKDETVGERNWMCEVRLTGVSGPQTNFKRSVADFWNAGKALTALYKRKIQECIPSGQRTQLFVVIMVDEPLPIDATRKLSPLIEGVPEWVMGECVVTTKKRN